jgi:hypothetical protein
MSANTRQSIAIPPMPHPGPFRSRLIPYVNQIKAWRRAGKTWKDVTEELAKLGVKTDPGTACRFIKRWNKKPYAIGAEPEEVSPPPGPSPAATNPGQAAPKPKLTPEEAVEEFKRDCEQRRQQQRRPHPLYQDDD